MRPVHYAVFNGSFDLGGRIYTGRYGHQELRKIERWTIQFDGEPSIELDYGGMHPRILYHLEGIDFRGDPYRLWGKQTTDPQRLMAKVLTNALINAKTAEKAVAACNQKMSIMTKPDPATGQRRYKTGKAYDDARELYKAAKVTGLTFKGILPLVMKRHRRIAHRFGSDYGIKLMRVDSSIALDILHHFAKRCIPCLNVHDSFIVPHHAGAELREVMLYCYHVRFGFHPVVK